MTVCEAQQSLAAHKRDLRLAEATVAYLRSLVGAEEDWLESNARESQAPQRAERTNKRYRGELSEVIDEILRTGPKPVSEIAANAETLGYVPIQRGRPFTKVVRTLLKSRRDKYSYFKEDNGTGKWSHLNAGQVSAAANGIGIEATRN